MKQVPPPPIWQGADETAGEMVRHSLCLDRPGRWSTLSSGENSDGARGHSKRKEEEGPVREVAGGPRHGERPRAGQYE
jgi:hypothetical protein